MADATEHRLLKFHILRYNPQQPDATPRMQTYELEEADGMTLFIALNEIREKQDPSLQFDFVCRAGICGSCGMMINGRPSLACRTVTKNLGTETTLAPLPVFELIGDLSVNTGKWMRAMSERLQTWVHAKQDEVDMTRIEQPMDADLAEKIYELDRCIECGCCVSGCGTARMRAGFRRRRGSEQDRALPPRPARCAHRRGLLRADRRRQRRFRLHVAARLPRRVPQEPATVHPARLHAPQDGKRGLEVTAHEHRVWPESAMSPIGITLLLRVRGQVLS